jgi:hypothetical protein
MPLQAGSVFKPLRLRERSSARAALAACLRAWAQRLDPKPHTINVFNYLAPENTSASNASSLAWTIRNAK